MQLQIKKTIATYSVILLILFVIHFCVFVIADIGLPEYIPGTPLNISGAVLMSIIVAFLIFFNKRIHQINSSLLVGRRMVLSTLSFAISELIFQVIRVITLENTVSGRITTYFRGVMIDTVLCAILSFFVAFQITTRKTARMLLLLFAFMIAVNLIMRWQTLIP